jgi:hypothetical protein
MEHVVGVELPHMERAYARRHLRKEKVINDRVGDTAIALFWKKGTASALDQQNIAKSRDIGASGVFLSTVDGTELTFKPGRKGTFEDEQTGSTWTILGEAVDGPYEGKQLEPLVHHNVFWFVWSAFKPEGTLFNP